MKRFRIFRTEPEGGDTFCGEETDTRKAKNLARKVFSQKNWHRAEVFVEKQEEILRLRSGEIGFRKK